MIDVITEKEICLNADDERIRITMKNHEWAYIVRELETIGTNIREMSTNPGTGGK